MDYIGASPDTETIEDFLKSRSYDGGFYITPHGTVLGGSSHYEIILEFQSELDIPNDEYEAVLRMGSGSDALERLSQSLLRRGNIYLRLWDDTWVVMLFGFNDKKKDLLYDMARELIDAGAGEMDPVQIQDLRTKWIGEMTLEDVARYRFGESKMAEKKYKVYQVFSGEDTEEGGPEYVLIKSFDNEDDAKSRLDKERKLNKDGKFIMDTKNRLPENRKESNMRTFVQEVMNLIRECRGENCPKEDDGKKKNLPPWLKKDKGDKDDEKEMEEAKRFSWRDRDKDDGGDEKSPFTKKNRMGSKRPIPKMRKSDDKEECMSKGNKAAVPSLYKKDNKDALGSKATSVARKQSKKV